MSVKVLSGDVPSALQPIREVLEDHADQIIALQRGGNSGVIAGPTAAGCLIVRVDSAGVPAAIDDDHPGIGHGTLRVMRGDFILRDSGMKVTILNISRGTMYAPLRQVYTIPILNKPLFQVIVSPFDTNRSARTPSNGIPAKTGNNPGSRICNFYGFDGVSQLPTSENNLVLNDNPDPADPNRTIKVDWRENAWWFQVQACRS